jgi:hypothetical protein
MIYRQLASRHAIPHVFRFQDVLNEFYQKGCQEKSSASTGGEMFSRDPAHWN